MGHIAPEHLAAVARVIRDSPGAAISLTDLARRLGTTFPTARRRLEAYAEANGLTLLSSRAREGRRGKESTTWYLRPALQEQVRQAVLAALPRSAAAAISKQELQARLDAVLPAALDARLRTRWVSEVLDDPEAGVITTRGGRLHLDSSTAKTGRMPAVKRATPPKPTPPPAEVELPPGLPSTLTAPERQAVAALLRVKTARTSELARLLAMSPVRLDGMVSALRRKLLGFEAFRLVDETLPDGETIYRVQR